jgi:ABC-2 type transport system permease protein
MSTNVMLTLIRREFWEHRALWIAPLAVAALVLLGAVIGHASFGTDGSLADPDVRRGLFGVAVLAFGIPQWVTLSIILWFYSVDCLYAERKDRSILFWKSMPVSDRKTVLSKFLVAGVIVPFGVFAVTLVTSLIFCGIWGVRSLFDASAPNLWNAATWWHVQVLQFMGVLIAALWYAPLTAYLLMLSAWARRNVSVWALVPPLVAVIVERTAFHTSHLLTILGYRLGGIWQEFRMGQLFIQGDAAMPNATAAQALAGIRPGAAFANVDLWLGLLVAAGFVLAAIRIRRYRDDT